MEKYHITDILPEYLDNVLDDAQKQKVETHLKECEACAKELEELKTLFRAFDDEKINVPSDSIRDNFFAQLEIEKQKETKVVALDTKVVTKNYSWGNFLKIAASIALLVGSFLLGKQQSNESTENQIALLTEEKLAFKQTAMLSLIENQSASKRIQGVNFVEGFSNPDEAIVKALTGRMLNDNNTNVRLAAVEALSKFAASVAVKSAFIQALETEKDPSVQIAIIQNLVRIQERKASKPMQKLLEHEDTQPFVKEEINRVLSQII